MGDTTWCYGKVSGKRQEDGKNIIEVEVWNDNQLGTRVTEGVAEILLPSSSNPDEIVWETD
jgi:hypothetical protein